jgi:hypothetical protein
MQRSGGREHVSTAVVSNRVVLGSQSRLIKQRQDGVRVGFCGDCD